MSGVRARTELIRCPACGLVQWAEVLLPDPPSPAMPWPVCAHPCDGCDYVILESEWETVGPDTPVCDPLTGELLVIPDKEDRHAD